MWLLYQGCFLASSIRRWTSAANAAVAGGVSYRLDEACAEDDIMSEDVVLSRFRVSGSVCVDSFLQRQQSGA